MWLEVQVSTPRERRFPSPPRLTRTPSHASRTSPISQRYESKVEIDSLVGIEDEDLVLYPTRQYIAGLLKRDAERPMVSEKERLARIADEGTRLARECAKLWRRLRDMPPGGTVEFEGGKSWDFDQVSPLLNSFRVLTKMTEPHPGCRAMWQCWSCDDGVKKGVCKHALIQHQTRGAVQAPGGVQASDRGEEAQARTPQEDRTCPLPPARG